MVNCDELTNASGGRKQKKLELSKKLLTYLFKLIKRIFLEDFHRFFYLLEIWFFKIIFKKIIQLKKN